MIKNNLLKIRLDAGSSDARNSLSLGFDLVSTSRFLISFEYANEKRNYESICPKGY